MKKQGCEIDTCMNTQGCEIHTFFSAPPARTQVRTARAPTRQAPTAGPRAKKTSTERPPSATALGSQPLARSHGRPPARNVLYCRPTHVVLLHDRCMWYYFIAEAVGSTVISAIPLLPRLDEHLSGILQERILIDLFASQRRRRH